MFLFNESLRKQPAETTWRTPNCWSVFARGKTWQQTMSAQVVWLGFDWFICPCPVFLGQNCTRDFGNTEDWWSIGPLRAFPGQFWNSELTSKSFPASITVKTLLTSLCHAMLSIFVTEAFSWPSWTVQRKHHLGSWQLTHWPFQRSQAKLRGWSYFRNFLPVS